MNKLQNPSFQRGQNFGWLIRTSRRTVSKPDPQTLLHSGSTCDWLNRHRHPTHSLRSEEEDISKEDRDVRRWLLSYLCLRRSRWLVTPCSRKCYRAPQSRATTFLARSMGNHYDPHASPAEEYSNSILCLGPISPPERAYEGGVNSISNNSSEPYDATPFFTYQMPSPCLTTTTNTSAEQTTVENEWISDVKVRQRL